MPPTPLAKPYLPGSGQGPEEQTNGRYHQIWSSWAHREDRQVNEHKPMSRLFVCLFFAQRHELILYEG